MPRTQVQSFVNTLAFNGSSSGVSAGTGGPSTGSFSTGGWIKPYTTSPAGTAQTIICKRSGFTTITDAWDLLIGQVANSFRLANNAAVTNFTGVTATMGVWQHVVWVHDVAASLERLYINGAQVSTIGITTIGNAAGATLYIGQNDGGAEVFLGKLAQIFIYPSALSIPQIQSIYNGSFPGGATALWLLNEGAGTTANDITGNGNTGTITSGVWSTDVPSQNRSAVLNRGTIQNFLCSSWFNGSSAYVLNSSVARGATFASAYSIEFWFKAPVGTSGTTYVLFSNGNSGSSVQFFRIYLVNSNVLVQIKNDAGTQVMGITSIGNYADGKWHHAVWVDNLGTCKLYVDGVPDASNFSYTPSGTLTLNETSVGCLYRTGTSSFLLGNVCGLNIYNVALNALQVFTRRSGGTISVAPILIWPLSEGAGTTAYDTSGNGNNGTITAGTYTSDVPSKTRGLIGGNLVYNGNFEFAPPANVAQTSNAKWIDGTVGGSSANSIVFGWCSDGVASGTCAYLYDSANPHSGNYSLKVSTTAVAASAEASSILNFNLAGLRIGGIPVMPSTSYTYSFWQKTVANSGSATTGAYISFEEFSGSGTGGTTNNSTKVQTTSGWTQYTGSFTTASTTQFIIPRLLVKGNDGTGTLIMDAWFDDITLVPTTLVSRGTAS